MKVIFVSVCFLISSCSSLGDNYYGNQCSERNPYVDGTGLFLASSVPMSIVAGASIGTGIGAATVGTYAFFRKSICDR